MVEHVGRWALAFTILAAIASQQNTAQAQAADPPADAQEAEARRLFEQARVAFDERRHAESLSLLNRSLELIPRASTALNLVRLHVAMGRPTLAREVITQLAAGEFGPVTADQQLSIDGVSEDVRSQIASVELSVLGVTQASLRVDGFDAEMRLTNQTRLLELDPGRHQLRAEARGVFRESAVDLPPGGVEQVVFDFAGAVQGTPQGEELGEVVGDDDGAVWIWITVGVLLAVGAAATVLFLTSGGAAPAEDPQGVFPVVMGLELP